MIWVVECFWGMQLQGESLYPVIWRRFQPPQCETSNRQCCSFKCCRSLGRWRKGPLIQISSDTVLEVFTMQPLYLVALRLLQRRLLSVREAEKGSNDTDGGPTSYRSEMMMSAVLVPYPVTQRGSNKGRLRWNQPAESWRTVQFCWPQSIMWVKPEN